MQLQFVFRFITLVLLLASPAWSVIETYQFDSEEQRQRYRVFVEELRCPKCQNQNLSGSNSPIAEDLRRELHRLLLEGKSDDEIVDFMVSRYGEFVLYRPPVNKQTAVLWLFPILLLILGAIVVVILLRRRSSATHVDGEDLHQQAQRLLSRFDEDSRR